MITEEFGIVWPVDPRSDKHLVDASKFTIGWFIDQLDAIDADSFKIVMKLDNDARKQFAFDNELKMTAVSPKEDEFIVYLQNATHHAIAPNLAQDMSRGFSAKKFQTKLAKKYGSRYKDIKLVFCLYDGVFRKEPQFPVQFLKYNKNQRCCIVVLGDSYLNKSKLPVKDLPKDKYVDANI